MIWLIKHAFYIDIVVNVRIMSNVLLCQKYRIYLRNILICGIINPLGGKVWLFHTQNYGNF